MARRQGTLCLLLVMLSFRQGDSQVSFTALETYIRELFQSAKFNSTLTHFTVSEDSNSIYVAGLGILYHLSTHFEILTQVAVRDDVVTEIITIAPYPMNKLITCVSGEHSRCQLRRLYQLTEIKELCSLARALGDQTVVGIVGTYRDDTYADLALYVAQTIKHTDLIIRNPVSVNFLSNDESPRMTNRRTMAIGTDLQENFYIKYAAVFSYRGYTYFLSSQMQDATSESPIVPKLSRLCHNHTSSELVGFTEITLKCRGANNTLYNIAKAAHVFNDRLFGVFVKNGKPLSDFNPTSTSALCMYKMEDLVQAFVEATTECACGDDHGSHINYLRGGRCHANPNLCGDPSLVHWLACNGEPSAVKYPERKPELGALIGKVIFEQVGKTFTSILIAQVPTNSISSNVAFIGTKECRLMKVRMHANFSGVLYEVIQMPYPVLSDMWISNDNNTIIVLTEKQLIKLAVANCSKYFTCNDCLREGLGATDPYCGWCTLENRCTRYIECQNSHKLRRWLHTSDDVCVAISEVHPKFLHYSASDKNVIMRVTSLPRAIGFSYTCHYGHLATSLAFMIDDNKVSCRSPGFRNISIPPHDDAVTVVLSLSTSHFEIEFVGTTFSIFDCNEVMGCVDCVTKWECDWCIDSLSCKARGEHKICLNVSSSLEEAGRSCPRVVPGRIFIPVDVERRIELKAVNLNMTQTLIERKYQCILKAKGVDMSFISEAIVKPMGTYTEFTVTCNFTKNPLARYHRNASLSLQWSKENKTLDGSYKVILYDCHEGRSDCSRCLSNITTHPEFQCGWCPKQSSCTVREKCTGTLQRKCSDLPRIKSVSPSSSAIEGGTIVSITGSDFGQTFEELQIVIVAGVVCEHQEFNNEYEVGSSVTCKTKPSNVISGPVSLIIKTLTSTGELFSYNDPKITSFTPIEGPASGGTLINIRGSDLKTGRYIDVILGGKPCHITHMTSELIECKNVANTINSGHILKILFDGHPRYAQQKFTYRHNPRVFSVYPNMAIVSGGNWITVMGENLHIIQRPNMITYLDSQNRSQPCRNATFDRMVCRAPSAQFCREVEASSNDEVVQDVYIGFLMDGVKELRQWSDKSENTFKYVRDPEYSKFKDGVADYNGEATLQLSGKYLALGSQAGDITVYIGAELCENVTLLSSHIICKPPARSPAAGDFLGNNKHKGLPYVIVLHANLEIHIGYLRYRNHVAVLVGACIALSLLFSIVAVISTRYFMKLKRRDDAIVTQLEKRILQTKTKYQTEMKTLFSNLRTATKNIEGILASLPSTTLRAPLEYLQVLRFSDPQCRTSTIDVQLKTPDTKERQAMYAFGKLLSSTTFLRFLVAILEEHCVDSNERANIASHITMSLVLDDKLATLTEFFKQHIHETGRTRVPKYNGLFQSEGNLHDMLLSNWIFVSLYGYMGKVGSSVLELSYAIKSITEMGPIDALTGKSQFSINDQNLLLSHIQYNEMVLQVLFKVKDERLVTLTFLDTDTISQVKGKILDHFFLNQIYSTHPLPEYFDLVWHRKETAKQSLTDKGITNLQNGWRKLSTLSDYKIKDGDCVELILREDNNIIPATDGGNKASGNYTSEPVYDYTYARLLQTVRQLKPTGAATVSSVTGAEQLMDDEGYILPDKGAATVSSVTGAEQLMDDEGYILPDKAMPNTAKIPRHVVDDVVDYRHPSEKDDTEDIYEWAQTNSKLWLWHLEKDDDILTASAKLEKDSHQTPVDESVLSYLPATKIAIQEYVDKMLNIFMTTNPEDVPYAIKQIFDLFDCEANNLETHNLAQKWKDYLLPRGLWTFILNNPALMYDIQDCYYVKACLQTLVQILHDVCLRRDEIPDDASYSRNLYAHLLPEYSTKLDKYYSLVQDMESLNNEDILSVNSEVKETFENTLDLDLTRYNLYSLICRYETEIIESFRGNKQCSDNNFIEHLESIKRLLWKEEAVPETNVTPTF
ncbi:plexin-A4-like isoform X4 [Apostichopus japonicus]|uniref:plexin-A4-like isoform X4 n=1 Tax=Stichopus japonicus TaxID=307972 RepID=UPI003AB77332